MQRAMQSVAGGPCRPAGGLRSIVRLVSLAALAASAMWPGHARAHPHVWVTMTSELLYGPDGALQGVRHDWTFDDMFSAFALQGIPHKKKNVFTREELKGLAQVNVTSLKEYGYFTRVRADKKKIALSDPVDYWLDYANSALTLHFTLPVTTPAAAKSLMVEIFDPTWFVDFTYAAKSPVALQGAPAGCKLEVQPATGFAVTQGQQLGGEAFFNSLSASGNFGAQFANKVFVQCP